MIAFFGMGLLGSNFVRALRARGEEVRVWNRTHARAEALQETGAQAFADPVEAARGVERLHLTLSDDAAVDHVLEQASAGFSPGLVIVDHTTTSTQGAARRARDWAERGFSYVHAPVFMGPQNAREATGLMLVSGDPALVARVSPALTPMTGKLVPLGDRPDLGAGFKLMGNLHLMFLNAGLADFLALANAVGVTHEDAASLFSHFNPATTIAARLGRMRSGDYSTPSWELAMARKDARLMVQEAAHAGETLAVLPAIADTMDALIAQGHGHDDWTVLGKPAVDRAKKP